MPTKAYSIMSGGMDSALATSWAQRNYDEVVILFFDWGQKSVKEEWASAHKICEKLGIPVENVERIKVPIHRWDKSSLTNGDPETVDNDNFMVPERNLMFISLAASYARANGGGDLIVGFNQDDGGYDTDEKFVADINEFFKQGTEDLKGESGYLSGTVINLVAPIIAKNKPQIREELKAQGLFELTYSCYAANGPCGRCRACQKRGK